MEESLLDLTARVFSYQQEEMTMAIICLQLNIHMVIAHMFIISALVAAVIVRLHPPRIIVITTIISAPAVHAKYR